ncbi:hypothetical protein H0H81_004276 [Sphagnurus paluster]|uniref:Tetratricopeptide repeat protein n=1 Tax=Sphagnurus paluster TaxID=117069 RepID=A0A9P7KI50_9AGAR|nr:hypothetical protein H0H81_004276 [Sphagnurus paluster]
MSLNNLANALQTRFEQWGASNNLDEAISSLNNLALALQTRFEQQGASNDLDEAISLHREVLLLRAAPHPGRSMSLNNLALALQTHFEQRSASNDLDEAIPLHYLAIALRIRFDQGHLLPDLTEAISLHKQLLDCPVQDPNRSWSLKHLPEVLNERNALIGDHRVIVEGNDAEGQSVI